MFLLILWALLGSKLINPLSLLGLVKEKEMETSPELSYLPISGVLSQFMPTKQSFASGKLVCLFLFSQSLIMMMQATSITIAPRKTIMVIATMINQIKLVDGGEIGRDGVDVELM